MDELVDLVVEKTGLPKATAEKAVKVVVDYFKDKLPDPIAGQIDNVLGGEGPASDLGDIAGGLGGLFGGKK